MNLLHILLGDNPLSCPVLNSLEIATCVGDASSEGILLLLLVPLPYDCAGVGGAHEPLTDGVDAVADVFVCFWLAETHVGVVVWIKRLPDHILQFSGVS